MIKWQRPTKFSEVEKAAHNSRPAHRQDIVVVADEPQLAELARNLAHQLSLPLQLRDAPAAVFRLVQTTARLELRCTCSTAPGPLYVDFVFGKTAHRRRFGGGRGQPLARAVGLRHGATPAIVDATAGLGRDAFMLASMGCTVSLVERSPVLWALLSNGLARARAAPETHDLTRRMQLIRADANDYLRTLAPGQQPDVVYLDPMYPRSDKSAAVKKEMQFLRSLLGEESDSPGLLRLALQQARQRVVVKRPRHAPPLEGQKPFATIASPNTRYDLYFP
jgi:16S rRNA (guanine1516-N2)-methyltransferase